jgi:hypothetical protein
MTPSYTITKRNGSVLYYRGALRIERGIVVWECSDEHTVRDAASRCGINRLLAQAPAVQGRAAEAAAEGDR